MPVLRETSLGRNWSLNDFAIMVLLSLVEISYCYFLLPVGPLRKDVNTKDNQALNCSEEDLLDPVAQASVRKTTEI